MGIVVDANIIKNYYDETVIGKGHSLTASAKHILDDDDRIYVIFIDAGGNIEHEWQSPVDPNWFKEWYYSKLISGQIKIITVCNFSALCKSLYGIGFPKGKKDIWYIRTAKASRSYQDKGYIVTEDIDFFNPKIKKKLTGTKRINCMKSCNSPVRKRLLKYENIEVMCVEEFISLAK
jgi:hypothetical protein